MSAFSDVFALAFRSTIGSTQAIVNTFHVRQNPTAGGVDAAHLQALLADSNTTSLINAYKAMLRTTDTLDAVTARLAPDPQNPDDPRAEASRAVAAAGTRTVPTNAAPFAMTAIAQLHTDVAGRRYAGRVWLPPPMDQSLIFATAWSGSGAWFTAVQAFIAELVKTTYPSGASHYGGAWNDNDLCIYSLKARQADASPYYARIVSIGYSSRIRWLRSRTPPL